MKKSFLLFSLATLSLILVGCNSNSQSSNSNSGSDSNSQNSGSFIGADGEISFDDLTPLLRKLLANEIYNASSASIVNTLATSTSITTTNETVEVYNSEIPSSASSGTVIRTVNGVEDKRDTFKKRNAVVNETYEIEVNGIKTNQTYPMFAQIVDYENENMGGTSYQDSAARYFIVASEDDATSGGLTSGSYVTTSDMLTLASTGVIQKLYNDFYSYVAGNVYAQQVGVDSFEYRNLTSGNIAYSCIVGYSITDDELEDTQYHSVNIQFITDADQTKLISAEINYVYSDFREGEDDNAYVNEIHWEATLDYDTRKDVPEDAVDVRDYFLQDISDIEIYTRENNNAAVDPDNIIYNSNYTYLFGRAKTYSPAKAVDVSITGAGSSNQGVVSFSDDGYFKIVGPGTTTLSFVYFGKDSDGVYREKTFEKIITVKTPNPESIRFTAIKPNIADNTLQIGQTYTFSVYALPITASQNIIISSNSNSDVVSATIDENNNVTVTALASGKSTITFTINGYESVETSITFTVASDDIDLSKIITQKTYLCDNSNYGFTFILTFNSDGTGSRIQHIIESGKDYEDTFTYTISANKITFTSWSDGTPEKYIFEDAQITQDGNKIICSCSGMTRDYNFTPNN